MTTRKSAILALLSLLVIASVTAGSRETRFSVLADIAGTPISAAAPDTAAASASERRIRSPKVIQLSYSRWYEKPGGDLGAFARGQPTSLAFATRYRGRRATAPGKLTSTIDTDLPRCCWNAWEPITREGTGHLYRLIRKALNRRGVAWVRTRVKRDDLVDDHRWRIALAQCAYDPQDPFIPWAARSGRTASTSRLRSTSSGESRDERMSAFRPEGEPVFRGREGLAQLIAMLGDTWDEWQLEPERFLDGGDRVVMFGRVLAEGGASGVPIEFETTHVWTVRTGRAASMHAYRDRSQALEAAGLRE